MKARETEWRITPLDTYRGRQSVKCARYVEGDDHPTHVHYESSIESARIGFEAMGLQRFDSQDPGTLEVWKK